MNRIIEIVAMCLGGFSLLAVSFLGFAVITGVPLRDLAVVGKVFEAPKKSDADVLLEKEEEEAPKTTRELIQSNLGALAAFDLPSPFNATELEGLETRLKSSQAAINEREIGLDSREEDVTRREEQLAEQMEDLLEIRHSLDTFRAELDERSNEVERDEEAVNAARAEESKIKAAIFAGMAPESAAKGLVEDYRDEAAEILAVMEDQKKARKLLNQIFQTNQEAWRAISEEYARRTAGSI